MLLRRSSVVVRASGENPLKQKVIPPAVEKCCKEYSERHKIAAQTRALNVRRIQQELQRITQRELEYAQRLFSSQAPVRISVNDSVWSKWRDFLPFRIEFVEEKNETGSGAASATSATSATNSGADEVDETAVPEDSPIA